MHGSIGSRPMKSDHARRVRAHVTELLESSGFAGSERRKDLLRYLVEESLSHTDGNLRAKRIATEVLGRGDNFDPQVDPIVRVEVGRVRAALDTYYRGHPNSDVVLDIPKGQHGVVATVSGPERYERVVVAPVPVVGTECELADALNHLDRAIGRHVAAQTPLPVLAELPAECAPELQEPFELADSLNAAFLVRGSVRIFSQRCKAHFELFDRLAGERVWSEEFSLDCPDMHPFDVEDWLVRRVGGRISGGFGLVNRQIHKSSGRIGSAEADFIAKAHEAYRAPSSASLAELASELQLAEHQSSAQHLCALSDVSFTAWWLGLDDNVGDLDQAEAFARRSVEIDPTSAEGHLVLAYSLFGRRDINGFTATVDRALELGGGYAHLLASAGLMIALAGDLERGDELCAKAVDLNPFLPTWCRVPSALLAIREGRFEHAWLDAIAVGSDGAFVGPALRIATTGLAGSRANTEDSVSLQQVQPAFATRGRELLGRVFLDEQVRNEVHKGMEAAGMDLP